MSNAGKTSAEEVAPADAPGEAIPEDQGIGSRMYSP